MKLCLHFEPFHLTSFSKILISAKILSSIITHQFDETKIDQRLLKSLQMRTYDPL